MSQAAGNPSRPEGPKKRVGSRHDKTGCLTCRYRRKKCIENTFPNCGACVRLNLECIRAPVRKVLPTQSPGSQGTGIQKQNDQRLSSWGWTPSVAAGGGIESPHHRHVFRYYVTVLAYHLTVSERFNSFLSALLPMAMESMPLRDSLFAFAAGHLSLTNQSYKLPALEARSKALRSLATSVNTSMYDIGHHEANAAACLTFVLHDVGVDAEGAWVNHLRATQHIIMNAKAVTSSGKVLEGPDAFKTSPEGEWILRNFAYHDIIGCITLRRRPLLGGVYLKDIADVVDSYIGLATDLLVLAAEIGQIQDETHVEEHTTSEEVQKNIQLFHRRFLDLEKQLLNWKCQDRASSELGAVAYAYRSAILIVLYRLIRSRLRSGYFSSVYDADCNSRAVESLREKIGQNVEKVLNHITQVPLGATTESPLLFPLFIAGGEALQPDQIEAVRSRLRNSLDKRQFQNIPIALEVLEDVWRRRGPSEPGIDWSEVLDGSGKHLLLT